MIVRIEGGSTSGKEETKYALIELQGMLRLREKDETPNGKKIGKLWIDDSNGHPIFVIGHHRLEGKFVKLKKPLACLRRAILDTSSTTSDGVAFANAESFRVDCVVREKIVFKTRPRPLISGTASGGTPKKSLRLSPFKKK